VFARVSINGGGRDPDIWWKLFIPSPPSRKRAELVEQTKLMRVLWSDAIMMQSILAKFDGVLEQFLQNMVPIQERNLDESMEDTRGVQG
jgi:hypothetical protein